MKKYICLLGLLLCILMLSGCVGFTRVIYADSSNAGKTANKDSSLDTDNSFNTDGYTMIKKEAYVLPDDTPVSLWESNVDSTIHSYRLKDGQELLELSLPIPITDITTGGLNGTKNMTSEALEAALSYYDSQGFLPDIPSLLDNAYSDYTLCQKEEKTFQAHFASQDVSPCVETERYVGFDTTIEVPRNETYQETRQVTLFDSSTGDVIPPEDLFTVSKEKAVQVLADFCKKDMSQKYWKSAKSLISLERVQWLQEGIMMYFYAEEFPDEDSDWEIIIAYDDLKEVLHPWAIPDNKK